MAENCQSAQALCAAVQAIGARHVFLMSSVAVYRPSAALIAEDQPPDPVSDYGRAKLAAEQVMQEALSPGKLTILRLGNLAGADALLSAARAGPVVLDPISGQPGGPQRSYIGPNALAGFLEHLVARALRGDPLPPILNVAQPPALAMADLLKAAGADWRFGVPRDGAIPRVALALDRLAALVPLQPATAASVVADLDALKGLWP